MKRFVWRLGVALACVCGSAFANGRYPIANQLVVSPGDDARLVLRTTFGLVLSQDQGKTFQWVCEKAAGFVNGEDPPVEVTEDSSILVASSQALGISHDGGCAWQTALDTLSIVDADVDPSQPKRAVAIASLYMDGKSNSGLEETLDNGNTWQPLGASFDGLPATVAIAPSLPTRIYASGTAVTDLTPLISTSDDGGATWHSYPLSAEKITVPFLAAVDPKRPEVVYVRAPTAAGTDVLVVSSDFGQTFKTLFKAKGGLYGFALSPDGSQVAVGGPNDPLSIASTADYVFKAVNSVLPLCLKWSAAGLYACADEAKSAFSLGLSSDSGATFKTLFRKPELSLLACPTSTQAGQYCPQAWVGQQATLGIDAGAPSAGAPSNQAGAPALGDAGASQGGSSGASAGNAGSGGVSTSSAGNSSKPKPASKGGGCSISAGTEPAPIWGYWIVLGVSLFSVWRRASRHRVLLLLSTLLGACSSNQQSGAAASAGAGQAGSNAGAAGSNTAGTSSAGLGGASTGMGGAATAGNGGTAGNAGQGGDPDVGTAGPTVVHSLALGDDFNAASDAALRRLGALYNLSTGQWTTGPRWSWANDVEASLANYERSDGLLSPYLFAETYELNKAKNFLDDLGYDDQAWWGNAWLRAYDDTGDEKYLTMSKSIFADMLNAWDPSTCGGGVWWNRNRDYKNAITNELFVLLAINLHQRTPGDTDYLNWAKQSAAWLAGSGMINASNLIDDGLTTACKGNGQTTWTYNQGVILGALAELYAATSDKSYLSQAQTLAAASTTKLVTSGGILQEPCEPNASCNDDQSNFKGIYQRHLRNLENTEHVPAYSAFLQLNAHSLWANSRGSDDSLGNQWAGPFDVSDAQRQNSGLQALHAAAPPWTSALPLLRAAGGNTFNHAMGRPVGSLAWRCDPSSCPSAGPMQEGPFVSYLPSGSHRAHFMLTASRIASSTAALATLEVRDETAGSTLASLPVAWSDFHSARVPQDFALPYQLDAAGHALSFRVLWQALSGAPALTVTDVAVDQAWAFSAANLSHDCGRLDVYQNWEADRVHDAASCTLGSGPGVALPAGHALAHFELQVDHFNLDDAPVATIAVLDDLTGSTVAHQDLTRNSFKTALFQDFSLEFTAQAGHPYDFVTTWKTSALAPRLTERSVYVNAATRDVSIALPFDTRGIATAAGDGSLDAVGSAFAAAALNSPQLIGGHSFSFGSTAPNAMNALAANAQSIALPSKPATSLELLLLAVNGTQSGLSFVVHYSDNSSDTFTQSASDWVASSPQPDESYAVAAPSRWSKTGPEYGNFHVFRHSLALHAERSAVSVTLPSNGNLKLFAATLVTVDQP